MKKLGFLAVALILLVASVPVHANGRDKSCTRLQDGVLTYGAGHYLAGQPLRPGYDSFGYNFQARQFNGTYANAYLGADGFPPYTGNDAAYLAANPGAASTWYWPYRTTDLSMKWDDAWLSTQDCDGDGRLDRHYGFATYRGSGAWLTNHQKGTYEQGGKTCRWNEFYKIVAAPADAVLSGGAWYASAGTEIGPAIWGDFAIIQYVLNDPCGGSHGAQFISPTRPGLGNW